MRVAVVHDWLYVIGGAERVLSEILRCYPQADVFALFDVLTQSDRSKLGIDRTHTSFLQKMPFIRGHTGSFCRSCRWRSNSSIYPDTIS